jgi:hypothetical protein
MAGAAGSGDLRTIRSIVVGLKGQSCYDCAAANCTDAANNTIMADVVGSGAAATSCDNVTGLAEAGPGTCQSRQALCYDSLSCLLQTNCSGTDAVSPCYCGTSTNCLGGVGTNGACKATIEAGFESTSAGFIANNFGALTSPVAGPRAVTLVQCMKDAIQFGGPDFTGDSRCTSCFK